MFKQEKLAKVPDDMICTIETHEDLEKGVAFLTHREPRFAEIVETCGLPPLRRSISGIEGLLAIITEQQISIHAAASIWARVKERYGPFDLDTLRSSPDEDYAACGLSRPKIGTIRAVLEACKEGELDFQLLQSLSDEDVHTALTAIKGIGPWTAEIYLLSNLGRSDVWPKGDLALQEAAKLLFNMRKRPDVKRMESIARKWRPWRAVAARLLWQHYRHIKFETR